VRPALALLIVVTTACSPEPAADARRYQLTGQVAGREAATNRVVIAHEAIAGLMPAMSMPFEIKGEAPPLQDGDRVLATLVVTASSSWLEDVRITAPGGALIPPIANRAVPGALVPALSLVDQDARPFTLRDVAGRVLVATFMYTRCPLPDFCPLMVRHLERVRRLANEEGISQRVALLGVTLDPGYDTPAVLRTYGESMLQGGDRFEQWTLATGSPQQIGDVARFFGVDYRLDNGLVTHTLVTAVVGADGRLIRTFPSNAWLPADVFEVVRQAVERANVK
jgi:protein SCO1/2